MRRWETRSSSAHAVRELRVLVCAAALLACGFACAKDKGPDSVVIWEGSKEQWVRLESRDDDGSPLNAHPVELAPSEVSGALASLSVIEDDEAPEPIFTSQEAAQLGEAIARALAQARPDQDATFRSAGSRPLTSGKVLKGVRVNSGRIFQQAGKLNLILGDVRAKSKTRTVYGQWEEDFSEPRPAVRSASPEHEWRVVAPDGVEQHDARDDWLAFDGRQLAALSVPATAPAGTASASAAPPPAAPAAPTPAAPAVQPSPTAPPAPAAASSPEADMERRLRTLKDLREKGLITEEAYRAKVEEILSVL